MPVSKRRKTVKQLQDRYDEARALRAKKEAREKPVLDHIKLVVEAPRHTTNDFWCNICKRDCTGTGVKQVRTLPNRLPVAWYLGVCPLGHRMIRRITDKDTDPYYWQSLVLWRQRAEMADMLLTPDDPRFKELYPKQYEELTKNAHAQ